MTSPAFVASYAPQTFISSTVVKGKVFWSGGESAMNSATTFAKANGLTTLEMTNTGNILTWATKQTSYPFMKPFWELASKRFASGATNEVNVFINFNKVRPGSVWFKYEQPILESKDLPVIYHSVK